MLTAEQELKNEIGKAIVACIAWNFSDTLGKGAKQLSWEEAVDQILALIKEAGWIDPSTRIMPGEWGTPKAEGRA